MPSPTPAPTTPALPPAAVDAAVERAVARHGAAERDRIAAGARRAAARWTAADGDAAAFADLCERYYVAAPADRARLLDRFERLVDLTGGHLYEIHRNLRRWSDLRGDDLPGIDDLLATFNPAPDLADQLYAQKLAFVGLLNFDRPVLADMLRDGPGWDVDRWAEARIAQAFGPRIPASVDAAAREVGHAAGTFVSTFHIPVDRLVDADGKRWFEPGRKLVAHWLVREQIKAAYAEPAGLPLQRALMAAMARHVDGTIPRAVMDGTADADWDPAANTLGGAPVDPAATVGPARYDHWLAVFGAARLLDAHCPEHPTAVDRRFNLEREIPEAEVERCLVAMLEHPARAALADLVRRRLGRDLEPFDVYCEDIETALPAAEMDALVRRRFADAAELERRLPEVLAELGFGADEAAFIGTRIRVEVAKGAGHAVRPGQPAYGAWLRTSSLPGELGWDAFDTAMHELGHNVEQLVSTHHVPRPALRGVPNTACTEAFAFLFQSLGRRVVGFASPPGAPDPFDVDAVQTALGACQIAGPALVDLYAWRWLYQNPDADAAALRDTVIRLAAEVWDRHYRAHFGPDRYHTLGAYQHMVAYPLYLPDYALGQIMAHQIRSHMRGRDLASETRRICAIGRITPDLWLRRAVGAGISPSALMDDAAAAVARMG